MTQSVFQRGRLTVHEDGGEARVVELGGDDVSIGRGADNDVAFEQNPYVSHHHCRLVWDGDRYVLHDLESRNGTKLNGVRLSGPQALRPGDRIELPEATLVYESNSRERPRTIAYPLESFTFDVASAQVHVEGRVVSLTANEHRALALLHERLGAICSKDEIARHVWPEYEGAVGDESVEQLVSRLRRKLEDNPQKPRFLVTVRGLGYRLVVR